MAWRVWLKDNTHSMRPDLLRCGQWSNHESNLGHMLHELTLPAVRTSEMEKGKKNDKYQTALGGTVCRGRPAEASIGGVGGVGRGWVRCCSRVLHGREGCGGTMTVLTVFRSVSPSYIRGQQLRGSAQKPQYTGQI